MDIGKSLENYTAATHFMCEDVHEILVEMNQIQEVDLEEDSDSDSDHSEEEGVESKTKDTSMEMQTNQKEVQYQLDKYLHNRKEIKDENDSLIEKFTTDLKVHVNRFEGANVKIRISNNPYSY